ncbi:Tuberous sclerosis 1 [Neolecta irregularis DAH-3]|uniref:Tuberous sclerosis 1 n=1 Tax=Neolecta irregularis (strain DAH-3) TaxID=1198029 RepID=A0A1U7LS72_NEOID|nr:Tuberous sclerosis 1 [Neolecta irregularis DAH-3]|eukprot:OLL25494.1 Tuberous sclerosis 1 [Neolecta irregularis DAH-3]
MSGSLKDLVEKLNVSYSATDPFSPLPPELKASIEAYLHKHPDPERSDQQKLNDELNIFYKSKVTVDHHQLKHVFFLSCLRKLQPALARSDLIAWWDVLVKPTIEYLGDGPVGQTLKNLRSLVLGVLVYDGNEDADRDGEREKSAIALRKRLFELYMSKTKSVSPESTDQHISEEQRKFWTGSMETLIIEYGKRKPKDFFQSVDLFIVQKEYRLQTLSLLCGYVRLQGPHLHQILQTPLFDHLLDCLQNDTSTTVISLALTIIVMLMPHICNSLSAYLPRLFYIYIRVLCWDQFGGLMRNANLAETKYAEENSEVSSKKDTGSPEVWQRLDSSFDTAPTSTPDCSEFFTFIYGLYPVNFFHFIKQPQQVLNAFPKDGEIEIDEESIRSRSMPLIECHTIHPNFLIYTVETELTDQSRWIKLEPSDVVSMCVRFNTVNMSSARQSADFEEEEESFSVVEEIPRDSHLFPDVGEATSFRIEPDHKASRFSAQNSPRTSISSPESRLASPAFKPRLSPVHSPELVAIEDKLNTPAVAENDNLSSGPIRPRDKQSISSGSEHSKASSSLHGVVLHELNTKDTNFLSSPAISPINVVRNPAHPPAPNKLEDSVAFLQREVLLLTNELNFQRHLKSQYLQRIGRLQREHILDSAVEAERQSLHISVKALKQQLRDKDRLVQETREKSVSAKSQRLRWEKEINTKFKQLREDKKVWQAEKADLAQQLQLAKEEIEGLSAEKEDATSKLVELKLELESLQPDLKQLDVQKETISLLQQELEDFDEQNADIESLQNQINISEKRCCELEMRLQSAAQQMEETENEYISIIRSLEGRLTHHLHTTERPEHTRNNIYESAIQKTQSKFQHLQTAHNQLVEKCQYLEVECDRCHAVIESLELDLHRIEHELQRSLELDAEGPLQTLRISQRTPRVVEVHPKLSPTSTFHHSDYAEPAFTNASATAGSSLCDGASMQSAASIERKRAGSNIYKNLVQPAAQKTLSKIESIGQTPKFGSTSPTTTLSELSLSHISSVDSSPMKDKGPKAPPQRIYGRGGAQNIK